jgi:hypothetical protein
MPTSLHILTCSPDPLAQDIIALQQAGGETVVKVVDLTLPEPDYGALLEAIFAADSVAVW